MTKIKSFILKHPEMFTILGLLLIFYIIFFHNIWAYALMDVDESRYVQMSKDMFNSKDFLTLYLNGEYFFEKPPLFFWGECLAFAIFGKITEWTARFPVALYGTITCLVTYWLGRKIISRGYGVVSSLILATSIEFVILSKFAILDILFAACAWLSIAFGINVYFCKDKNKKYFWWLFYIFSGLAVMAKGLPGFVVPFGSIFFVSLYFRKFKDIFKPQYFLVGIFLFLLIILPWHIIMLKMHDPLFFNEYIIKHHIQRFFGSETINRKQPFYFYVITLLWGFMPWIISSLAVLIRKLFKWDFSFREIGNAQRFIACNAIIAGFIFIFFSCSGTKLITYILPIYPTLACLVGYIWFNYIERGEYSRIINKTVYAVGAIFIAASITAMFTPLYLPEQLNSDISIVKPLLIIILFAFGLLSIIFTKKRKYIGVFFSYVLLIAFISAYATEKVFKIDYKFGQDELMKYAQYADEHNKSISTYRFGKKYSLMFYSGEKVEYGLGYEVKDLQRELDTPNNLVIIEKKVITDDVKKLKYKILFKGRKYDLIEKN